MDPSFLCRIELLNAHAASLLSQGEMTEASKAWSYSLRQVLPLVLETSEETEFGAMPESSVVKDHGIILQCMRDMPKVESSDERVFSLFPHAFHYSKCESSQNAACNLEETRQVAACIVYNIALCHHLLGLQGACNRVQLNKALTAYKAARDLLYSTTSDITASNENTKILALAIANNEGHILDHLFEKEQAKQCLQQLRYILSRTCWSEVSEHFHVTAVLFPSLECLRLHAPAA